MSYEYEPEDDPRWIPPSGGAIYPDIDAERKQQELTTAQKVWADVLDLFEQPGWAEFERMVKLDRDEIDHKLIVEKDPMEWKVLRGQLEHADWILAIPSLARSKHRQVLSRLGELMEQEVGNG